MIELLYGTKDFSHIAWTEITGGRPVVLRVVGWKKTFVHRILSSYSEYDRLSRTGAVPRGLMFGLAWRTMLAPSLMGLCDHARSSGMAIVVRDRGTTLEVRFEKEQSGTDHK